MGRREPGKDQSQINTAMNEERSRPYKDWRFSFYDGMCSCDVDQVEYTYWNNEPVPVGIIETTMKGDGKDEEDKWVDDSHMYRYLDKLLPKRIKQMRFRKILAKMLGGIPALYVVHTYDMEQIACCNMNAVDTDEFRWYKISKEGLERWIRKIHKQKRDSLMKENS